GVSGSPATSVPYQITATFPAAPPWTHGSTHVRVNSKPATPGALSGTGLVQLAARVGFAPAGQLMRKMSCRSEKTIWMLSPWSTVMIGNRLLVVRAPAPWKMRPVSNVFGAKTGASIVPTGMFAGPAAGYLGVRHT